MRFLSPSAPHFRSAKEGTPSSTWEDCRLHDGIFAACFRLLLYRCGKERPRRAHMSTYDSALKSARFPRPEKRSPAHRTGRQRVSVSIGRTRSRFLRRMRSGRRLIHIIADTEPANSADGIQTLLKSHKAAVRGSAGSRSILSAPRIILRLGRFFVAEEGYRKPNDEQQTSHRRAFYKHHFEMPGGFAQRGRASARRWGHLWRWP